MVEANLVLDLAFFPEPPAGNKLRAKVSHDAGKFDGFDAPQGVGPESLNVE